MNRETTLSLCVLWLATGLAPVRADEALRVDPLPAAASPTYEVRGTDARSNPVRLRLAQPFAGDVLFVSFRVRYDSDGLDTPQEDDGEFFVLWLDEVEGNNASVHSGGVPNLGVHVSGDQNRFLARFASGGERYAETALAGDRWYQVVGRLWKSAPGVSRPFDALDIWIDPAGDQEFAPHASANSRTRLTRIGWAGLSTGRKTEPEDLIRVTDVRLTTSWQAAVGRPTKPIVAESALDHAAASVPQIDFASQIHPLLTEHCFACHAGETPDSGVRLDVLDELLNQVVPGDASRSRLVQLVETANKDERMPPADDGEQLTVEERQCLRDWVDQGIAWDERLQPTPQPKTEHWAFQPIRRPDIPPLTDRGWVRTPVDAFIARRHEQLGIRPNEAASKVVLARRLWLDMTGLPPTASNRRDDRDRQSYDELIERAIETPQYGERWGRHWLDVARWAESNGHQHNRDRPDAWRYRDYVVRSFNADKPFDRFVREQIAGDEIAKSDEQLIATGFLAATRYSGNELDKNIQRNDILVDVANTTAKTLLGLTMECAQCHSHKFDPISLRDYYRFQAFFAHGQPGNVVLRPDSDRAIQLIQVRWQIFDDVHQRLVRLRRMRGYPEPILVIPKSVVAGVNKEERQEFDALDARIRSLSQAWCWYGTETIANGYAIAPHEMRWPLPSTLR